MDQLPGYSLKQSRPKYFLGMAPALELWLYVGLLGLSEMESDLIAPLIGVWVHALLAAWLVYRAIKEPDALRRNFLWALTLLPLVRIISFAISAATLPALGYIAAAGVPLLGAALTARQMLRLSWRDVGMVWPKHWEFVALALVTAPLVGWGESLLVHPAALIAQLTWSTVWLPSLLLLLFAGVAEELLFRGVLQHYAVALLQFWPGILYVAVAWGLLHLGWHSWLYVLGVMIVGAWWGWIRQKTGSIYPTIVAHGAASIMLFLIVPFVK